jgi:hypothetical protein
VTDNWCAYLSTINVEISNSVNDCSSTAGFDTSFEIMEGFP